MSSPIPNHLNHQHGGFELRHRTIFRVGDRVRNEFFAWSSVATIVKVLPHGRISLHYDGEKYPAFRTGTRGLVHLPWAGWHPTGVS